VRSAVRGGKKKRNKEAVNLSVHQVGGRPRTWIPEILETDAGTTEFSVSGHHKYPDAGTVLQVHKVLNDIEILAGCTPVKVGESPEWTTIVNSAEENRTKFCKGLDGKPLSSALYCMYMVTLNELKALSAQAKHCGTANKTSSGTDGPGIITKDMADYSAMKSYLEKNNL
jgi:hypothetical protein